MAKYIIKRILLAILILFGVSLILYILVRCMPMNYIESKFLTLKQTNGLSDEDYANLLALYGLDDDSFLGILKGYWNWLSNFLQGDLGKSWKFTIPVTEVIGSKMGVSFAVAFVSLIIEMLIAIPLGIKCACNQYGKLDYIVTFLCMIGISFPSFFLGNMFIKWFAVDLGWFDVLGGLGEGGLDTIWHLVLPITVMVIIDMGALRRYTRTNTLEVLNADYIRTARAKGLSNGKVIYKHVFRNTLIPLITTLSFTLPTLFGGAMISEQIFNLPGIGQAAYQALSEGDINLIMGYNMFLALLTVLGTLLADIMYAVVDPRVKLGK